MKSKIISYLFIFIILLAVAGVSISMTPTKNLDEVDIHTSNKPVILLTVDSLMSEPLQKIIEEGDAPALSFLMNNGHYLSDVISSYPTMSVTIDSTILTGTYADQHNVPGLIWFNNEGNQMISYGSGMREIWHNGVQNVVRDSIINLNNEHLNPKIKTIYEELADSDIKAASINGLIFRGNTTHHLNVPRMLSFVNLLPKNIEVDGPQLFSLGALSQYNSANDKHKFIWNRMGLNNNFTVSELKYLIEQNKLPPFTLAYLPDLDMKVHKNGPEELKAIKDVDLSIQELLNQFPSWEEAVKEVVWVVMGDSAQSLVEKDKKEGLIDLNELLNDFSFWNKKNPEGQLAIAINERMAYINLIDENMDIDSIIEILKEDKRIGFISWADNNGNYVASPEKETVLSFSTKGDQKDLFNQNWHLEGDLSILDISISEDETIQYSSYPDALARLNGALHSHEGRFIIVDAKPSYEFIEEHSRDHAGGGAHGSLHEVDSIVPLINAGSDVKPKYNRLVDFKNWLIEIVGPSI
ncbi:alkaline phosphatase family protein [Ureibacillus chungkukjangi]|uniref:alkaline phosphatase family protein n=1 Tax=Ureibacillus chungkukjangi TaxID=1202712 RepID=UPI00203C3D78|nr:alkaline phosphatase family protein [Ureibacillus chungkukjangi]MCM3388478.1 alkaline phosphatase family protein [Ureibacillus chungkukjangi]